MGKMSDMVARSSKGGEQFYACIEYYKPFCLNRYWQRENEYALLRKYHTERQQDGIYSTRGSYRCQAIELLGHLRHHAKGIEHP